MPHQPPREAGRSPATTAGQICDRPVCTIVKSSLLLLQGLSVGKSEWTYPMCKSAMQQQWNARKPVGKDCRARKCLDGRDFFHAKYRGPKEKMTKNESHGRDSSPELSANGGTRKNLNQTPASGLQDARQLDDVARKCVESKSQPRLEQDRVRAFTCLTRANHPAHASCPGLNCRARPCATTLH
jgi:hypothetical protein